MASEIIKSCPVCNHENFNVLYTCKDYTSTKESFELKICASCGFIITSPRPNINTIGKYYASDNYISHTGKSKTLFDKLYLTARNITLYWKHQLITHYFQEPANILDYGCGTGEFLNYMQNKGWEITGVEPVEIARQKSNYLLGNKVVSDMLEINGKNTDVITLWHVLEHIHDLNSTIQKLKSLLKPDGIILIAVPNPKSHDCEHYKSNWAGYDVPRHLWHFNQETMTRFLKNNGLKLVDIKPMKLDSFYVSLLSEGYQNPEQSKLLSGIKAFIEGMKSNMAARKTKEYSSLIYITRAE